MITLVNDLFSLRHLPSMLILNLLGTYWNLRNHESFPRVPLHVLQWNCRGARDKLTELQQLVADCQVICLQKTLLLVHIKYFHPWLQLH